MNKLSGIGATKTLALEAQANKKDAGRITKIMAEEGLNGGDQGSIKAGFVGKVQQPTYDDEQDASDGFDPQVKKILRRYIDYSCPKFRAVIRHGMALVK